MVSNKGTPAKTLKKDQLAGSVKELAKKKKKKPKTVVKTTLENPYALQWPDIDAELERDIVSQLKLCCLNLQIPMFKPPRSKVLKLKGMKRKLYCQEYKRNALKELYSHSVAASEYEFASESLSHLIFGYNAVMRALEQNRLAGILVKKNLLPSFLGQVFYPGCVNNCIPFVPVMDLDYIFKDESMLAVKHNIIVVGLKPAVQEPSSRFYPLYNYMKKVVGGGKGKAQEDSEIKHLEKENLVSIISNKESCWVNPGSVELPVDNYKENKEGNPERMEACVSNNSEQNRFNMKFQVYKGKNNEQSTESLGNPVDRSNDTRFKTEETNVSKNKLTPEEINSYHLKRVGKGKRAFIPVAKESKIIDIEEDVIVFETSKTTTLPEKNRNEVNKKNALKEVKKIQETPAMDIQYGFFLDTTGDEDLKVTEEEDANSNGNVMLEKDDSNSKVKKNPEVISNEDSLAKKKRKVKPRLSKMKDSVIKKKEKVKPKLRKMGKMLRDANASVTYVSAKTKRIKNNPNRKSNKKKQ